MAKKRKKFPGESDSNVFARVASRAVREAREDNRGELEQPITVQFTKREFDQVLSALRYWQRDMDMDGLNTVLSESEIDTLCERINSGPLSPTKIFVSVRGGVAEVANEDAIPQNVAIEIVDFDSISQGDDYPSKESREYFAKQ
jgi:hypothetical protein